MWLWHLGTRAGAVLGSAGGAAELEDLEGFPNQNEGHFICAVLCWHSSGVRLGLHVHGIGSFGISSGLQSINGTKPGSGASFRRRQAPISACEPTWTGTGQELTKVPSTMEEKRHQD